MSNNTESASLMAAQALGGAMVFGGGFLFLGPELMVGLTLLILFGGMLGALKLNEISKDTPIYFPWEKRDQ